jgi:hypothetical protein
MVASQDAELAHSSKFPIGCSYIHCFYCEVTLCTLVNVTTHLPMTIYGHDCVTAYILWRNIIVIPSQFVDHEGEIPLHNLDGC